MADSVVADRKAYITLDRPERLNAIDRWMPVETDAPVERANDDGEVHIIVSGDEGRSFCSATTSRILTREG